jgi:tetratricopeptide (TPR) repeat protein
VAPLILALGLLATGSGPGDVETALLEGARFEAAGDLDGALETYRWALENASRGSLEQARTLDALAAVEINLGQYAVADGHARDAAEIYEKLGESKKRAFALNTVGVAALSRGAYADAAEALESAIKISSSRGDHEDHAKELGNLGNVYLYLGRYSDAMGAYGAALAVMKKAPTEQWVTRRERIVLANQATVFMRLGRYQEALAIYQKLGQSRDLPAEEQAQLLAIVGVVYRRLGDPIKALATYDDALRLFTRAPHVDGKLGVMKNRGIALALDLNRFDEAERSFSSVIELARRAGNRRERLVAHLYRGATLLRDGHPERARSDFTTGLALARKLRTPEEEWKALYGLGLTEGESKEIDYLTQAVSVIEGLREGIRVPSLRSDFFNDNEKRDVYDALIARRLESGSVADVFNLIERAHSRPWREQLKLSGSVDLASVQRALPAGVLLLDYWSSGSGSAMVAVTSTRAKVTPVTLNEADVKALIDGLAAGAASEWRQYAETLGAHLLPPAEWFDGVEHVVVVTDGKLALVPFELLATRDGLLIQHAAVSYTPTVATLLRAAPPMRRWAPPWQLQLRAFGDPVFTSASFDDPAPLRKRLHAAAREVRAVASEIGGQAAFHVGTDNRKEYLRNSKELAPILHLATHAMAVENAMEQSRIVFSPADSGSSADYLFLEEAYKLRLTGIELAVLSACETERGPLLWGEGVRSFSRAFLAAGARSTVTTLWPVADAPTADFMRVFYHHLQRGEPRDEALRRAKLRFLESGSTLAHPHFWAAFVLTGDGIRPIPPALMWRSVIFAGLVFAVAVAGGARAMRQRRHRHVRPFKLNEDVFGPARRGLSVQSTEAVKNNRRR